jgi:hypothetical protein
LCDPESTRKLISKWWGYFVEGFDKSKHKPVLGCKLCGWTCQHPAATQALGAPTSGIQKHIKTMCPYVQKFHTKSRRAAQGPMDLFIPSAPKTVTQEDIAEQTLKFFISGNVTFNQADNPEFDDERYAVCQEGVWSA